MSDIIHQRAANGTLPVEDDFSICPTNLHLQLMTQTHRNCRRQGLAKSLLNPMLSSASEYV